MNERRYALERAEREAQEAEMERRIAAGEIKRPRERGGRRSYYHSGPGRRYHETDYDAREDGYKTGKRIAINPAVPDKTSNDSSPKQIDR